MTASDANVLYLYTFTTNGNIDVTKRVCGDIQIPGVEIKKDK